MSSSHAIDNTPITPADRDWLAEQAASLWGAGIGIGRGVAHHCRELPGVIGRIGDDRVGVATYHIHDGACGRVTIEAVRPQIGVGSALLKAVEEVATDKRLWLITTNDNLDAIRFYQRRGFVLVAVHVNAIERSRQLKPQIPRVGCFGIEMRDELEFERAR